MTKPTKGADDGAPTELDARGAIVQGLQPLFNLDDRVEIYTLSGAKIEGVVEDANGVGILVRNAEERLFFVAYTSMDNAEIFEDVDDGGGDGEKTDDEPAAAPADGGAPVTPISTRAA